MKAHSSEVIVFVRIRPTANFSGDVIECLPDGQTLNIHHRKDSRKPRRSSLTSWSFQLEGVLQDVSQEQLYVRVCRPVVLGALDGYNGTVMCFGQTGAGKSYTMMGSTESYKQRGVIPRALQEVFQEVERRSEHAFSVHLSYLEIYNETLVDLLSSRGSPHTVPHAMVVTEEAGGGVFVRGLSLHAVHSEEEALNLLFEGDMNHIIGSHALNKNSSRSHCVFTVHIQSRSRTLSDAKYVTSKLNLVDLAGSERLGKTGSAGQTFKEATYINKSLSFLEQAILALADRHRDHVPFRQTKLTHVLKDSLGGNCNTVLVANVYGEAAQIDETLSTLRFASRMKRVRTNAGVNEHLDPAAQIRKLKKDVQTLKDELSFCNTLVNRPGVAYEPLTEAQLAEIHGQVRRYLEGSLEEISVVSVVHVQAAFARFKVAVREREQEAEAEASLGHDVAVEDQSAQPSAAEERDGSRSCSAEGSRKSSSRTKNRKWRHRKQQGDVSPSRSKLNPVQTPERNQEPPEPDPEIQKSHHDSARSKAEAFEDFKVGRGGEVNGILRDNKAVLVERRGLLRQLAHELNAVKREMDVAAAAVQQETREDRERELLRLRELKVVYRHRYAALRDLKAEVNYCQYLVDQSRVRLLSEFESWYQTCFLAPEEEPDGTTTPEGEKPGSDHELLPDGAESFYKARYRVMKRRNSTAPRRLPPLLPVS